MPGFEVFADDMRKTYRNNESKFEVDPDNNRIRLRDNADISGNLYVTGHAEVYGNLTCQSTIFTSQYITHYSDNDTRIGFTTDSIVMEAGGITMLSIDESSTDAVVVNQGGVDVNFVVESADAEEMLFIDGGSNIVGIGAAPNRSNVLLELNTLNNADAFIAFDGTSASNETAAVQTTTSSAGHVLQGYVRVLVNNATRWIACYD